MVAAARSQQARGKGQEAEDDHAVMMDKTNKRSNVTLGDGEEGGDREEGSRGGRPLIKA